MTNAQIALRISGTKVRQAGFAPLVISGVFPDAEEKGLDRPLTGCNGLGFVVKHTPIYSFYMAVDGKVRAFDTTTPGVLTVAISIPADYKLAANKTPYSLLTELYNLFVREYMTESADGRHVFQNVTADTEMFKALLGRYELEHAKQPKLYMNPAGPTGKLNVPADKMNEFFKDSFYPEFQNFKDIEVGDGLVTSAALQNITIPRRVKYQIYVNGSKTGTINSTSLDEEIKANKPADEQYCYEYCRFTLRELIDNKGHLTKDNADISLDTSNERIDCLLKKKEIPYKIDVYSNNVEKEHRNLIEKWLRNGNLIIKLYNSKDASHSKSYKNVSAEAIDHILTLKYNEIQESVIVVDPDYIDGYIIKAINKISKINTAEHKASIVIDIQRDKSLDNQKTINDKYAQTKPTRTESSSSKKNNNNRLNNPTTKAPDNNKPLPEQPSPTAKDSRDPRDSKIPLLCALLIGILIGFAIGFFVNKYLFTHEPTEEQKEQIIEEYKKTSMDSTDDALINPYNGNNESLEETSLSEQGSSLKSTEEETTAEEKAAAEKAAAEKAEATKQAIELFKIGDKTKFQNLCNQHPHLKQYAADGYYILNTLQTAHGNTTFFALLVDAGYVTRSNQRADKSYVNNLDQLKSMRRDIERIKQEAQ